MEKNEVLNEIETALLDELQYLRLSNKDVSTHEKFKRLQLTTNVCKVASVLLAAENLRERQKQNVNMKHSELRKAGKLNGDKQEA